MSKLQNVPESLLKYETPILVSSSYKATGNRNAQKLAPIITPGTSTEDYLNKILPPQEITSNNQLWVRYVSSTPATTFDVKNLAASLDAHIS